jgi:hypothetical protein
MEHKLQKWGERVEADPREQRPRAEEAQMSGHHLCYLENKLDNSVRGSSRTLVE